MNREIEFRAWYKKENRMVKIDSIDFTRPTKSIINISHITTNFKNDNSVGFEIIPLDDIELMQYTGLKDKNGVKIFAGDIVKCGKKIAVVKYGYHNCGCCHDVYGFTVLDNNGVTDAFSFEYCEVIGNIYENPELLEVEDD